MTEQLARHTIQIDGISYDAPIEDEEFKEACSFFHRGVEYSLLDDRPSGFINETIATVTNFFWCEIKMSNVQALFGD